MSITCQGTLSKMGVTGPSSLDATWATLQDRAAAWSSDGRTHPKYMVHRHMVFVHACELGQVLKTVSPHTLQQVVTADPDRYRSAVTGTALVVTELRSQTFEGELIIERSAGVAGGGCCCFERRWARGAILLARGWGGERGRTQSCLFIED